MSDDPTSVPSVYHDDAGEGGADGAAVPKAFVIEVFVDEETDDTEPGFYGAATPGGGAIARCYTGRSIFSLADPQRFADRVGGILRWV